MFQPAFWSKRSQKLVKIHNKGKGLNWSSMSGSSLVVTCKRAESLLQFILKGFRALTHNIITKFHTVINKIWGACNLSKIKN